MTYLLSLVANDFFSQDSTQILCYYVNDTSEVQIVRAMSGVKCHFDRIVFAGERILFLALTESYLEVYSSQINSAQSRKIDCKALHVNEKAEDDNFLAKSKTQFQKRSFQD